MACHHRSLLLLVVVAVASTMKMTMMTSTMLVGVDGFQLMTSLSHHRPARGFKAMPSSNDNCDDNNSSSNKNKGDKSTDATITATTTSRRSVLQRSASVLLGASSFAFLSNNVLPVVEPASARLEAVDRPDLLPKGDYTNIIQTEKYLTSGQAKRLDTLLTNLEKDTGFRVRVLCQQYPNTPGLAIRDYWSLGKDDQKDDKYVVLVVDNFNGRGNALNFNVGDVSFIIAFVELSAKNLPSVKFLRVFKLFAETRLIFF